MKDYVRWLSMPDEYGCAVAISLLGDPSQMLEQSDFAILVPGLNQSGRQSGSGVVVVCETLNKRTKKPATRSSTAAGPLSDWSEGKIADQLLPKLLWRAIQ